MDKTPTDGFFLPLGVVIDGPPPYMVQHPLIARLLLSADQPRRR
jgi:hypothetical protein